MIKIPHTVKCIFFIAFFFQLIFLANGQNTGLKTFPPDNDLVELVTRYIQSPITKTIQSNGDVFLQRDLTNYLQSSVFQAHENIPAQQDYGHDHKDAMLRTFLNRPQPSVATMNNYFINAATEFKVPVNLLKAIAQVQSNWTQMSESMYGSWGVMGIIENKFVQQITKASSLLNLDPLVIKNDARENIRAAAALMAYYQKTKPAASGLEDWFESVKELTGLTDKAMKNELAIRIYDVLKKGSKTVSLWGEIILMEPINVQIPQSSIDAAIERTESTERTTNVDYPDAVANFTTCNFNSRPGGSTVNFYFLHYIAVGTYQGTIDWFKNCTSQVSAHYVVRNSDGLVSQVVAEANRAWTQGVNLYNDQGIGVEHEVLASNLSMWDSEPMLVSAAKLCINVSNRWSIPKIRRVNNGDKGIYGHNDVRATDCPNLTQARWDNFLSRLSTLNVSAPVLHSIANSGSGTELKASWKANTEPELAGYRLYYADDDGLTNWSLAANETTLTAATNSVTLNASQFLVPPTGNVHHFKLSAVVRDGSNPVVESSASDIYSRSSNVSGAKVLIVDGFDRTGGSYTLPAHSFAASYFNALRDKGSLQISSVANEKVEDGTFVLNNYNIVVWFVGDESSANVVFSAAEKAAISSYLDNGGQLIVSGSEIAYNIGRSGASAIDLSFMNNYLKSNYDGDGAINYTPAIGITGTPFEGLNIPFGITYAEDFPDAVLPVNGSISIFDYSVSPVKKGGVAYKGTFGTGSNPGALIYLSYTLETATQASMNAFMEKALQYLNTTVTTVAPIANNDAAMAQTGSPKAIRVLINDVDNGTPINPSSMLIVQNPANGNVVKDNNGKITYTSNPGFSGNDQFQYRVQNNAGQSSNNATVSVQVVATTSCDPDAPEKDIAFPKRDIRGAWVATVSNIDWPSARTLSSSQQQAELRVLLDTLSRTGINTVFLQIRPECDALYASAIEPWSYWLTNSQGTAPSPFWDPLTFAIAEAHARGMELHAWINPYRAKQSTPTLAANHVAVLNPSWTFVSGSTTLLDPGLPQVRTYLTRVIADIAGRYDVDGIHFDDYFYPYAGMTGQDNTTFTNNNPTVIANIEDWRRNNINLLIGQVYDTISFINAATKRNVIFGVSPFGIWKSGTPAGIAGTSSFSQVYCDPIAWLKSGKVDYIAPQLYWKITGGQDYDALSKWWNDQGDIYNRFIYPGLALYKMVDANNWAASEIENQVAINRAATQTQLKGQILFSSKQIMDNSKGLKTSLQNNQFRYKSFSPVLSWKDIICPRPPVNVRMEADSLRWDTPAAATDGDLPRKYVVYRFANSAEAVTHINDGKKVYSIVYGNKLGIPAADLSNSYFLVSALDKNNNESEGNSVVLSVITGIRLIPYPNNEVDFAVGPNPFVSEIHVSKLKKAQTVELMDATGRLLLSKTVKNESSTILNVPYLSSGIYYLRVVKSTGEYGTVKLVKL